jgi:hypothetical protein
MNVRSEVFGRLAAADRAGELPDYVRQFLGPTRTGDLR